MELLEVGKICFFQLFIIVLVCFLVYLPTDAEEILTLWNYMDGHGITSRNLFDEIEYCKNSVYDDCSAPKLMELCSGFLLILTTQFAQFFICEEPSPEEKMNVQPLVIVVNIVLVVVCVVFLMLLHALLFNALNMKQKIAKKIDDGVPHELIEGDLDERSTSEMLPLQMMVELKPMKKNSILATEGKNGLFCSEFNKPTFDHCFQFRRDQKFGQTLTVAPATINLASYFASGTYGQPGSGQELHKEGVRLTSFRNFPTNIPISAIRLAQAGFYYLGEGDRVKCFSCGETYQGWQQGDRPALVHARISPNCSLVRGSDTVNTPLPMPITNRPNFEEAGNMDSGFVSYPPAATGGAQSGDAAQGQVQMDAGSAVVDSKGRQPTSASDTSSSSLVTSAARMATTELVGPVPSSLATPENSAFSGAPLLGQAVAIDGAAPRNMSLPTRRLDLGGAVYPLYSQMDARKRSFSSWIDAPGLPNVDELITLGFFFAGYADCVRCFFCGIGLKSWEPGDIPAEVHARWRPTCEYLRLVKGDEFVDMVANGGRNVNNSGQQAQNAVTGVPGNTDAPQGRDSSQVSQNPSSSSSQQGTAPSVPDLPIVRRARETGYTDQQIAEAIEKLRVIGMESAIDVMLVEILTNLFSNNAARSQRIGAANQSGSSTGSSSNNSSNAANPAAAPARDSDIQHDGAQPDEVPDNGAAVQIGDQGALQERHNALQQENARLRDMRTCQRCRNRPVGVIFLPCGHIIACTDCAPNMRRCTRCDGVIRATANVFFS